MRIMIAALMAAVSIGALLHPAMASDPSEAQIRVVPYSALKRTSVQGVVGQPTTITFPKDENIYRVVQTGKPDNAGTLGDAGWQGAAPDAVAKTPLGNNLTLWPVAVGESTMTVITKNGEGDQKVYPFRLVAVPDAPGAADDASVVLNLIFAGTAKQAPVPPATASAAPVAVTPTKIAVQAWMARQKAKRDEQEAAEERIRTDAFNGADGECHYTAKGRKPTQIEPRCPMDNGQWTLMRFPGLSKKPAIYIVTGDDEERLARQHAAGDFVVVEEIAQHFRLRLGANVLDIINQAYDPVGHDPGTGTTSPTVDRVILKQASQ